MYRELMEGKLWQKIRTGFVLSLAQWIAGFVLLVVGFHDFPDHHWLVATAVIYLALSFELLRAVAVAIDEMQNYRFDQAERKTRQTVVLAHQWRDSGQVFDGTFWAAVDDAVEAEIGPAAKPAPMKGFILLLGGLIMRGLGYVVAIEIAATLTA